MVGISRAHRDYAATYNIEVTDRESLSDSLFLAESSIIDLFSDLLEEKRGFKYNLFAAITLKRWNNAINRYGIETIYIRSDAVTVTNKRFNLGISYEKFKNILNIWCGEDSGWIVDKIEGLYIDTANYDQLVGTIYISLPIKINNPQKGLIHIENKDTERFKWCHIRFINPTSNHPERINKQDKKIASALDYRGINCPMKARDYEIVGERYNINVNVFGYENKVFPLYVSKNPMNKY